MSQTKIKAPTIYNPKSQTQDEVISNFVIRLEEFQEIFSSIKKDKMKKPPQHYMIQGQRGYGKTTLLLRLYYEIKDDKELKGWLIPVIFDEEQYSVRTLAKFWEEIIDYLEDEDDSFTGLTAKIDSFYDTGYPEEKIFELLVNTLKKKNKKLVLLLDNFGEMTQKFTKKEIQRLREVLITSKYIRLVGASSTVLEFYYNYKDPFFDFFKVVTLDELTHDETITLLRKLSETYGAADIEKIIEEQPERIEAIRRLTSGVPRTIVLLFEIFIDDVDGNSIRDLEIILDRVTPLYKHRLDNLSTQQQAIVDAIAQNWDAISTKEISGIVRMPSKAVSSQLNQLEKSQLVKKIQTSTKNQLYQINERFFNIYYLMRLGKRKNRNKVIWLIKFFEVWCNEKELTTKAEKLIKAMQENQVHDRYAFYVSQALSRTKLPNEIQHNLLIQAKKYLTSKQSPFCEELDKSHIEVYDEVVSDIKTGNIGLAKQKLIDDGVNQSEIGLIIGDVFREEVKDYKSAIPFYLESVHYGLTDAMFNLAWVYAKELKDYESALIYYTMAAEKGEVSAMFNMALLYQKEYKDYVNAEKYYIIAAENGAVDAMINLGLLYKTKLKNPEKAVRYYKMAIERGDFAAMNNLALIYFQMKKNPKEALNLQRRSYEGLKDKNSALGFITTLLWNKEIEEAMSIYKDFFENEEIQKDVNGRISRILIYFLASHQFNFIYNLFDENKFNIQDKYKPIYYALLSLMGDEYKDELKKMGSELKETVNEVLKEIKEAEKNLEYPVLAI